MNAETAGHVGTPQLKQFHMVYTKEFPRGILDQVISETKPTGDGERAPGPGPKLQAPRFDHHEKVSRHTNRGAGPR